jgi:small subunit ribosomal protein S21
MRVYEREPIGAALRRFKRLLERSGLKRELRKRAYYEKPCDARRHAKQRRRNTIRKAGLPTPNGGRW